MTTPSERSQAFIFGLELLQELCNPTATPRVPKEIRERARHALRHFPSTGVLMLAVDHRSDLPDVLRMDLFDVDVLDQWVSERMARRPALGAPSLPKPAAE